MPGARRLGVERISPPSRAGGMRPSTRFASVTVGALAALAVADRSRIGARAQRSDLEAALGPIQAIEPPPVPTVTMSSIGVFTG